MYPSERAPRFLAILLRISLRLHLHLQNSKKSEALAGLFRTILFKGKSRKMEKYYPEAAAISPPATELWKPIARWG